jgi:hypothetical protein
MGRRVATLVLLPAAFVFCIASQENTGLIVGTVVFGKPEFVAFGVREGALGGPSSQRAPEARSLFWSSCECAFCTHRRLLTNSAGKRRSQSECRNNGETPSKTRIKEKLCEPWTMCVMR